MFTNMQIEGKYFFVLVLLIPFLGQAVPGKVRDAVNQSQGCRHIVSGLAVRGMVSAAVNQRQGSRGSVDGQFRRDRTDRRGS
jgi:hypothetical protein